MRITRSIVAMVATSFLVIGISSACKQAEEDDEDEEAAEDDAPATPSPYTMSLDIDIGEESTPAEAMSGSPFATTAGVNAGLAALVIGGVTFNIGAQMVVPIGLLTTALEEDPIPVTDGVWLWSFDFENQGATWTANLTGSRVNDTTNSWSMSVTRDPIKADGCCSNFVLFSGVTSTDGKSGNWQVYDASRSDEPEELFQIIFNYESETERALTYTVNSDKPATSRFGQGSIVTYTVTAAEFNLLVDDSAEEGAHTIKLNMSDKSGSYTQASGAEYCWDTLENNQVNVACP